MGPLRGTTMGSSLALVLQKISSPSKTVCFRLSVDYGKALISTVALSVGISAIIAPSSTVQPLNICQRLLMELFHSSKKKFLAPFIFCRLNHFQCAIPSHFHVKRNIQSKSTLFATFFEGTMLDNGNFLFSI